MRNRSRVSGNNVYVTGKAVGPYPGTFTGQGDAHGCMAQGSSSGGLLYLTSYTLAAVEWRRQYTIRTTSGPKTRLVVPAVLRWIPTTILSHKGGWHSVTV